VDVYAFLSFSLWGLFLLFGAIFLLQRLRWRRRVRRGDLKPGFRPSVASAGNALHQLQTFVQPQVRYVIAEQLDEESEEEDSGDPDHPVDPIRHLHRQAKRIRKGEQAEPITALVPRG
jgi:hypothetical protein